MSELLHGVVKWFNDAKGFGFIQHTSGKDVFVHFSVIESEGFKTLKDGEEVDYELREGDKGLNASRVIRSAAMLQAQAAKKQEAIARNAVTTTSSEDTLVERIKVETPASETSPSVQADPLPSQNQV